VMRRGKGFSGIRVTLRDFAGVRCLPPEPSGRVTHTGGSHYERRPRRGWPGPNRTGPSPSFSAERANGPGNWRRPHSMTRAISS
jgi:hypothetical protein